MGVWGENYSPYDKISDILKKACPNGPTDLDIELERYIKDIEGLKNSDYFHESQDFRDVFIRNYLLYQIRQSYDPAYYPRLLASIFPAKIGCAHEYRFGAIEVTKKDLEAKYFESLEYINKGLNASYESLEGGKKCIISKFEIISEWKSDPIRGTWLSAQTTSIPM